MAKGKKKDKAKSRKTAKKRLAKRALVGSFAGGLLGKVVEKVLADTIEGFIHPPERPKHAKRHGESDVEDVAARLLDALASRGPRSIPQLLADTRLGLSPVLQALHRLRDFGLITFAGEPGSETVEATRSGADALEALQQIHDPDDAAKPLRH